MSFANDERVYVASYKEIALLFLIFSIILIVIYPKDLIKQQVLKKTSNYDLSILYLQNILRQDPTNDTLTYMLATQSINAGKLDLASSLVKKLCNSKDLKIKKDAYILAYKVAKQNYFLTHNNQHKKEIKINLRKIFITIIRYHYYTDNTLDELYYESQFLDLPVYTYVLLKEKISSHPYNIAMLTNAYYLANSLEKPKDVEYYLHLLETVDNVHSEKWYLAEYNYFMIKKDFKKAEKVLKYNARESLLWKQMLVNFYLNNKNYSQAVIVYKELFNTSNTISEKKQYFIQTLRVMQANNIVEANSFVNKYQNLFLNDADMRILLLRFYLGTNNPKSAAELSKKILYNETR